MGMLAAFFVCFAAAAVVLIVWWAAPETRRNPVLAFVLAISAIAGSVLAMFMVPILLYGLVMSGFD